ncbi:hypothetical protein [Paludifilum halophilum]|uniref:Transposase n=1 Tax=Paludifilum halophilum TaxID=1642702 RepID=A0A235B804_9BACL|nr:hypothetical protein [Paludifilum halophilum]OYD08362.1 hypothetical protein CHM34_05835 [Paludifilum halophilum]
MPKSKLTDDEKLALVLAGLKGNVPLSDLLRQYGVSQATYYKLRDRFLEAGQNTDSAFGIPFIFLFQ